MVHGSVTVICFDWVWGGSIKSVASRILETGKIIGGLAILENAYHETAQISAVSMEGFFEQEAALLVQARELMGSLPVKEIDVFLCERMGKDISGTGLDPNITGRSVSSHTIAVPWQEYIPSIWRIVVEDLSAGTEGNAIGVGFVDFITEKLFEKIDYSPTNLNALVSRCPQAVRIPVVMPDTRRALLAAINNCPVREEGPRVIYCQDTLRLDELYVSEGCLPLLAEKDDIEVLGEPSPFAFDEHGYLISPFAGGGE